MSGLLPRNQGTTSPNGNFISVITQILTVNGQAVISSLIAGAMQIASLVVNSLSTPEINSETDLTLNPEDDLIINANGAPRLTITTIPNNNAITNMLGLDGTTLQYKNNIVDTVSIQTISNKNLIALGNFFVDNSDNTKILGFDTANSTTGVATIIRTNSSAFRIINLPDLDTTLIGRNTTDTLTNKTLYGGQSGNDVLANKLLSSVDIISPSPPSTNQVLLTTSSTECEWSFIPDGALTGTVNVPHGGTGQSSLTSNRFLVGNGTSAVDLTKVVPSGVVIGDTDTQTLTNKTIDSASNTVQVSGTNINSLVNQDVRTTASPTFSALSLTNGTSFFGGKVTSVRVSQTSSGTGTISFATIPIPTLNTYLIETNLVAYCTAGPNVDQSSAQRFISRAQQVGGVITGGVIVNNFSNQFATGLAHTASGTDIIVQTSGIASDDISWAAVTTVYTL